MAQRPTEAEPRRSDVVAVGVIALVLAAFLAGWWFSVVVDTPAPPSAAPADELVTATFDPPAGAIERALVKGDGQVFATQATDPLARTPELVRGGPDEQAYRYQRPAYGWLGWLASGGGARTRVPWALIGLTVASTALLAAATARYLGTRGVDPRAGLLVLLLPGVFVDLTWIGPEVLGLAGVVTGLHLWGRRRPDQAASWWAVACFAGAGLCRETLLVVPAVLALLALRKARWTEVRALATAAAPYVAWVLYLRVAVGAWPRGNVDGRLSLVPLAGLAEASSSWTTTDVVVAVGLLGLALAAVAWGRRSGLVPVIVVQLALAALLGEPVWHRTPDFARVLLPLGALSILALLTRRGPSASAADTAAGGVASDAVDQPAWSLSNSA